MTTTERGLSLRLQKEAIFDKSAYSFIDFSKFNEICAEFEQRLADIIADRDSWSSQCSERVKDWDEMRQRLAEAENGLLVKNLRNKIAQLEGVVAEKNSALQDVINYFWNADIEKPVLKEGEVESLVRGALKLTAGQPEAKQITGIVCPKSSGDCTWPSCICKDEDMIEGQPETGQPEPIKSVWDLKAGEMQWLQAYRAMLEAAPSRQEG